MSFLIRTSAFIRKEIIEVVRQPRLILALVLGPFLILALFGAGYRNEARPVRTLFVADPKTAMAKQIQEVAPTISPQLVYVGMTANENEAKARLKSGDVDMVVVVPNNAYQEIRSNQQASFQVYQNEIDPAQVGYIEYLAQTYVSEVNRRVLQSAAQQGQTDVAGVQNDINTARQNVKAMKDALQAGDVARARVEQRQMQHNIGSVALAVGASVGLLSGVQQDVGSGNNQADAQSTLNLLNDVQSNPTNKGEIAQKSDYTAEIQQLDKQDQDLAKLQSQLNEFQSISPTVLTQPFAVKVFSMSQYAFTPMNFFTPGVIILLLQHVVITVAALSIVRERRSGAMELFRVSPVTSGQALIGKYISYLIFGAFIALALALLLNYGLNAPMLGQWWQFAVVVLLVMFAATGIGFFISLVAGTESQAVQFAMIALLLSVFFSGFILDLRYLYGPVKIVSWLLPATYGTVMLQDIMLRGRDMNLLLLGGLIGIGVAFFLISWFLMRRRMAHE